MSDRTIDEATPDTQVTGVENIPVSDGGSPKCVTVTQVKDFVLSKIGTIANVSTPAIATDGVYIKRNSELKPISAQDLANAIISFAFSKEEVSTLTTEAVIVIKSGNDIKTTDVNELAQVVKDAIELDAFNIAGLTATTTVVDANSVAIDDNGTTKKVTSGIYASYVIGKIASALTESTSALAGTDYIICANGDTMKKVKVSNSGLGTGNVIGPSANNDGKIPQWDGANSKTLKDGLSVTGTVASGSSSTEIPTAAAVYSAISSITVSGDVTGPASSTDGQMALFNGTTGKVIKTGGSVSSAIGVNPSTTNVTTEKAVSDAITAAFTSALASGGSITTAISNAITAGLAASGSIKTAIDTATENKVSMPYESSFLNEALASFTSNFSDKRLTTVFRTSQEVRPAPNYYSDWIPTEKAVRDAIETVATTASSASTTAGNAIPGISSSTDNDLVQWNGATGKAVKGGLHPMTTIPTNGVYDNTHIPTEGAVGGFVSAKLTESVTPNHTVSNAIASAITASVGTGGTVKTAIGTEITAACTSGGTINTAIGSKITAEMGPTGTIGSAISGMIKDEGQRTNEMAAVIGVRYTTDPTTGDQVPHYGRYGTSGYGNVFGPSSSTTSNNIPQWDAQSNHLKNGLELTSSIAATQQLASDSKVPTEKAVRTAVSDSATSVTNQCLNCVRIRSAAELNNHLTDNVVMALLDQSSTLTLYIRFTNSNNTVSWYYTQGTDINLRPVGGL